MTETLQSLRRKMEGAGQLESVVRTMKVLAAASIGQYERAVLALADYYRTVELGLVVRLRKEPLMSLGVLPARLTVVGTAAIVFGSDEGLVGQFNEELAAFVGNAVRHLSGDTNVWAVGERVSSHLKESGLPVSKQFPVPNSVAAITPLVSQILMEIEAGREKGEFGQILLFHNQPKLPAVYEPSTQRLLPLDERWRGELQEIPWPAKNLPQVIGDDKAVLLALIREYLFVSLFKTCAESLASENGSRLAAMQRAEKNIQELSEDLTHAFQRQRQSSIDEELFDVFSGFNALLAKGR